MTSIQAGISVDASFSAISGTGASVDAAPYELVAFPFPPGHFRVHAVRGRESLSKPYRFDVTATSTTLVGEDLERITVGQRAALTIRLGGAPRVVAGVIESVRSDGLRPAHDAAQFTFRIVPKLALLRHQRGSRIFQDVSIVEVVEQILSEHGVATSWQLTRRVPARAYITQYEESDLEFVHRLLAEAGIFYAFASLASSLEAFVGATVGAALGSAPGPLGDVASIAAAAASLVLPTEVVVFGDEVSAYAPVGSPGIAGAMLGAATALGLPTQIAAGPVTVSVGAPAFTLLQATGLAVDRSDKVLELRATRRVRSDVAEFRDFDPARPHVPLVSRAPDLTSAGGVVGAAASAVGGAVSAGVSIDGSGVHGFATASLGGAAEALMGLLAGHRLETYEHHGHFLFPDWQDGSTLARQIRTQRTRKRVVAEGRSVIAGLAAGHRFRLEDHPIGDFNREHVVVSVEHRGDVGKEEHLYENRFTCVPADVVYPPARPVRRTVQAILTATVVGPAGEEIHVDALGRIKVLFHWDRRGIRDDRASCWVRSVQPWAGTGFGHQFIPRMGMEVAITFEGGDPDKPVCIGSLYNGTHGTPFGLPANKTQSGIRTQSSPGGGGFNELCFEDAATRERIYLHAQRDLDEEVGHDHTLAVQHDETIRVDGNRRDRVGGDADLEVVGERSEIVRGDVSVQHFGSRVDVVEHAFDQRVAGPRTTRIEGTDIATFRGASHETFERDHTTRVLGNETVIVGKHDAKRAFSLRVEGQATLSAEDGLVLEAPGGITLRCGATAIRIGEDGIELLGGMVRAKGEKGGLEAGKDGLKLSSEGAYVHLGDKLLVKTENASMSMGDEVKLDGKKILMNSPDQASDEPPPEPPPPTEIELVDQDGKALAHQRFVIELDDGSQRTGVTDGEGKAKLDLPSGGTIRFPELSDVQAA